MWLTAIALLTAALSGAQTFSSFQGFEAGHRSEHESVVILAQAGDGSGAKMMPPPSYWGTELKAFKEIYPEAEPALNPQLEGQIGSCLSEGNHPAGWFLDPARRVQVDTCMKMNWGFDIDQSGFGTHLLKLYRDNFGSDAYKAFYCRSSGGSGSCFNRECGDGACCGKSTCTGECKATYCAIRREQGGSATPCKPSDC